MRLADATRSSLRELLIAELAAAGTRARDAGCPPEVLAELLDARSGSLTEDSRGRDRE
ncbi:hypothetical protein OHS58_02225 [Amycolatopsis sp. NBC_00348]|uniref:hypothetical protein n=1 Tax=Amycolatopsis sp. NBC_00348 TaxID=2975956 RepID=UPI002E26F404